MHLGESVSVFMVMVDLQAAEGVGGILYAGNSLDLVKKKKKVQRCSATIFFIDRSQYTILRMEICAFLFCSRELYVGQI